MFKSFKGHRARVAGIVAIAAVTVAGIGAIPASALSSDVVPPNTENLNVAKVVTGYGSCTGVLIDSSWVATVSSCFVKNPAEYASDPALVVGKPALPAKVLFGSEATWRENAGNPISWVVPYKGADGRDLILAKLTTPAFNFTPMKLGSTAPLAGDKLDFIGWGRTKDQWVPKEVHKASFNVDAVNAKEVTVTGFNPSDASLCLGDSGAPGIRVTPEGQELVALNSRSWQKTCIGSTQTKDGAFATRVDDTEARNWIQQTISGGQKLPGVSSGSIVQLKNNGIANTCLGLPIFSQTAETVQQSVACALSTREMWEVTLTDAGTYIFKQEYAKQCLSVAGGSSAEFSAITQAVCDPQSKFQEWKAIPAGGGQFLLQNAGTGLYIDANGITQGVEEKLAQRVYSNRTKQQWTAAVVSEAKYGITEPNIFLSIQATLEGSKGASVRHLNGVGNLASVTASSPLTLRQDATWKIVPGLADPKCYSFESINFPGKYLYAGASTAKVGLIATPQPDLATWCGRPGKNGANSYQFQWYANATRLLRHNSGVLYAGQYGGSISGADSTDKYNEMTSWTIGEKWATPTP